MFALLPTASCEMAQRAGACIQRCDCRDELVELDFRVCLLLLTTYPPKALVEPAYARIMELYRRPVSAQGKRAQGSWSSRDFPYRGRLCARNAHAHEPCSPSPNATLCCHPNFVLLLSLPGNGQAFR